MPQNWAMGVNPNATQLLDWGALKDAMQTTQHNKAKYVPCSEDLARHGGVTRMW